MKYLGIDPGGTTGLALIEVVDKKMNILKLLKSKDPKLNDVRGLFDEADLVVCEDWRTRPREAQKGAFDYSPMNTVKLIGVIEERCLTLKKELVLQQPAIKPIGYSYANLNYKKGKQGMHIYDAVAHVAFYLVTHQLARPA
jgi:hypothetical protein